MSKPFMKKLNPFKPTDIGGCQLWLDGADPAGTGTPPSNGATVSTWVDKATAKNATATGTSTYLTGGGINFTGSSYFLNQTFSQNISQRSIFIVFQVTTYVQFAGVLTIIPNPNSGNDQSSTNGLSSETITNTLVFNGNFPGYQSQIGSGNPLPKGIYYDSMNGTAGSGYFNGTNATNVTASYTAGTCSGYGLGGRWQGGSMSALYRLNGVIYEILFFNTTLSTPQRQKIEGYLAQKWGLEANLPAGSPGRTQVIYPHTLRLNSLTTGQPTRLPLIRQRATTLQTITFTYTGSLQSFVVPATTSSITVYMWGAGGGGGYVNGNFTPGSGGAGAMIQGTFSVTPGQTLYIIVGGRGSFGNVNNQTDAEGGGGKAYYDVNSTLWGAGSGGGRSAIQLSEGGIDYIVVGGGGGGAVTKEAIINGGSATFSGTANGGTGSTGGTQISGGTPGFNGETGSKKFGGAGWLPGNFGGGGGGGGYWGGGGGGIVNGYGSGGGGSSYTENLSNVVGYNSANGIAAPNIISQYYQLGIAVGGSPSFTGGTPGTINLGGNGLVVLTYYS